MPSLPIHFDRHVSIHINPESEESIDNAERKLDTIEKEIQALRESLQHVISNRNRKAMLAAGWEEFERGMYRFLPGPELSDQLYESIKEYRDQKRVQEGPPSV